MTTNAVVMNLKSLKLFGMASAVAELAEQGAPAYHQSTGLLDQLIKAEVADREVRSINYQMKIARFPAHRELAGFEFKDSAVNEAQVRTLHRCEFLDDAENIVLIGGPGTGKKHIATAIDFVNQFRCLNGCTSSASGGRSGIWYEVTIDLTKTRVF